MAKSKQSSANDDKVAVQNGALKREPADNCKNRGREGKSGVDTSTTSLLGVSVIYASEKQFSEVVAKGTNERQGISPVTLIGQAIYSLEESTFLLQQAANCLYSFLQDHVHSWWDSSLSFFLPFIIPHFKWITDIYC